MPSSDRSSTESAASLSPPTTISQGRSVAADTEVVATRMANKSVPAIMTLAFMTMAVTKNYRQGLKVLGD